MLLTTVLIRGFVAPFTFLKLIRGFVRLLASQSRHATLSWLSQFAASVQASSDLVQVAHAKLLPLLVDT